MSELSFEQMLEDSIKTIHTGEIIEGTVISVKEDYIVLNIGYKADGIVTRQEYSNIPTDLTTVVSVGDKMTVKVLRVNDGDGQVALTYKRLASEKINKELEEAFENKTVMKGTVEKVLSGGLSVRYQESYVFVPASLVSDVYEKDLTKYQGQEIEFVIIEFNPKRRRVIGDRKQLVVAEKEKIQSEALAKLEVGQIIEGTVKNVTDFGIFVDIGGIDGLVHVSEMSWGRVGNPRKLYKAGDTVKAFIKDINDKKIALSFKFEDTNPWINASEKFAPGVIVTGTVARMTDFGAFIELEPGVDALLHVSQISRTHVDKPADVLKIGQEIEAQITEFDEETQKISLSMKVLEPVPVEEQTVDTVSEEPAEDETVDNVEETAEAPVEE
ncbi:MAG: 30S ribosomal protein S1 [Eubacterium sp.]